jgi:hypothetical protein
MFYLCIEKYDEDFLMHCVNLIHFACVMPPADEQLSLLPSKPLVIRVILDKIGQVF